MNPEKPELTSENREQFADRWLDAALGQYSAAEPPAGLSSKILQSLASAPEPSRLTLFPPTRLAWTFAAAAVVLCSILLGTWHYHRAPRTSTAQTTAPEVAPSMTSLLVAPQFLSAAPTEQRPKLPAHRKAAVLKAAPLQVTLPETPRRDQFPSPAPLSDEEHLILAYIQNTPRQEVLLAVAERQWEREKTEERFNSDNTSEKIQ